MLRMSAQMHNSPQTVTLLTLPEGFRDSVLSKLVVANIKVQDRQTDRLTALTNNDQEILAAYFQAWVDHRFKAVAESYQIDFGRLDSSIITQARYRLLANGYLLQSDNSGYELSAAAFEYVWTNSKLKAGLVGVAREIQPSQDFQKVYADGKVALLTALENAQGLGTVTPADLANILGWAEKDVLQWSRNLIKAVPPLICLNNEQNGLLITADGKSCLPTTYEVSLLAKSDLPSMHDLMRSMIPDLINQVVNASAYTLGLTFGEITKALGTQGFDTSPMYSITELVEAGVLKSKRVAPDKEDPQLSRLNKSAYLYTIADPDFVPTKSDYDLKDFLAVLKGNPGVGSYRCTRDGKDDVISKADVSVAIEVFAQEEFSLGQIRSRLFQDKIVLSDINLKNILNSLVADTKLLKLETPPPIHLGKKNKIIRYKAVMEEVVS